MVGVGAAGVEGGWWVVADVEVEVKEEGERRG